MESFHSLNFISVFNGLCERAIEGGIRVAKKHEGFQGRKTTKPSRKWERRKRTNWQRGISNPTRSWKQKKKCDDLQKCLNWWKGVSCLGSSSQKDGSTISLKLLLGCLM